jgi:hypothetical protein
MGIILVTRADGSTIEVRTNVKTKRIRLGHEHPVCVDLSALGATPALTEMTLNGDPELEGLDLSPLAGHPALGCLTASSTGIVDLGPLATTKLQSLTLDIGGSATLDMTPLEGHPTLSSVALT